MLAMYCNDVKIFGCSLSREDHTVSDVDAMGMPMNDCTLKHV